MKRKIDKIRFCSGLTLMEMTIAMVIMVAIFAVLVPQLKALQSSWNYRSGSSEMLQNGRVLIDHLQRSFASASQITAVSGLDETNGYIEFQDNDANNLRYEINGSTNYLEFGPVANLAELAGPVSKFQITCYDACDLDTPLNPVTSPGLVRLVNFEVTFPNSSATGQDLTVTTSTFLRTDYNDTDEGDEILINTYRDEFNETSYSGNDGTLTWSSDWQEINESDGPVRGDEIVMLDPLAFPVPPSYQLRIRDNDGGGEGVMREADIGSAMTATLSFIYRRENLDDADDYVAVEVSINGTFGPWIEITRFTGPDNETAYQSFSQDISAYIDANFAIRFSGSPNLGNTDGVWFDEVEILLEQQ